MKSTFLKLWHRKSPIFFIRETHGNYTEISYNGYIRHTNNSTITTNNSTITKRLHTSGQYSISLPYQYLFYDNTGSRE